MHQWYMTSRLLQRFGVRCTGESVGAYVLHLFTFVHLGYLIMHAVTSSPS